MKTLILNGSARKNGDTAALINAFTSALGGEYIVFDCHSADISPCTDCRVCREKPKCAIEDDMNRIYDLLCECDNLVIASPVHFEELSSVLLKIASRLQVYCSAKLFRKESLPIKAKKGAVLLTQGGCGGAQRAYETAVLILKCIGINNILPLVLSKSTDSLPAEKDTEALKQACELAKAIE